MLSVPFRKIVCEFGPVRSVPWNSGPLILSRNVIQWHHQMGLGENSAWFPAYIYTQLFKGNWNSQWVGHTRLNKPVETLQIVTGERRLREPGASETTLKHSEAGIPFMYVLSCMPSYTYSILWHCGMQSRLELCRELPVWYAPYC